MKKIKILLMCGAVSMAVAGCNFLDIVPDDTATLADAFADDLKAEGFLHTCYSYQPLRANQLRSFDMVLSDEIVPSQHWNTQWFPYHTVRWGMNNSTNPYPVNGNRGYSTDLWQDMFAGIRQCYIFLNNIDGVVPTNMTQSEFGVAKEVWKGETWALIGYYHYLLFQYYGPIPVVEGIIENQKLPRLPIDQVVEKIIGFYDKALETVTDTNQDGGFYGRITKEAVVALKSKVYLFAASPLFNGSQAPYSNLEDKEGNKLIPAYSKEKWKTAMDAAKAAIDIAKSKGHALYKKTDDPIKTTQGVNFVDASKRQAYLTYRYMMMARNNPEVVWGYTGDVESSGRGDFQEHTTLRGLNGRARSATYPSGGFSTPLSVVKLFYSKDGQPIETDPNRGYAWTPEARMTIPAGGHSANLNLNREPRFYAAVGYTGGVFEINESVEYLIDLTREGTNSNSSPGIDATLSGYSIKKYAHPEGSVSASSYSIKTYPYYSIRLADLYLMYVEACAAYNGSLDATAKGYLKEIHDRAGLDGNNVYFANYTGNQLTEAIRRERMIELVYEGHWYNDMRRWLMSEKWHNEGMWGSTGQGETNGVWGVNILGASKADHFKEIQLNSANGFAGTQMYLFRPECDYLFPIRIGHLTINDQLVQNPGY